MYTKRVTCNLVPRNCYIVYEIVSLVTFFRLLSVIIFRLYLDTSIFFIGIYGTRNEIVIILTVICANQLI